MSSDSGPYPSLLGYALHSETDALLTLVLTRTGEIEAHPAPGSPSLAADPLPLAPRYAVRHYKGGLYDYFGEADCPETGERLAVYRSRAKGRNFVRPAAMFGGPVTINTPAGPREVARFARVDGEGAAPCAE